MSPGERVLEQLDRSNVFGHVHEYTCESTSVVGEASLTLLVHLRQHPAFQEGVFHGLHPEVGKFRKDFRAHRGSFGEGSLQVVVDAVTGRFYADIDQASPYEDLVSFVWHSGEVIGNRFRRLFRRVR